MAKLTHGQFRRALETEVGLGVAVGQMIGDLTVAQHHVQRHHRGAGFEDAVVDNREIGQVGTGQRDLVARPDAQLRKPVGHLVGGRIDRAVGQLGFVVDHGNAIRDLARTLFEHHS